MRSRTMGQAEVMFVLLGQSRQGINLLNTARHVLWTTFVQISKE